MYNQNHYKRGSPTLKSNIPLQDLNVPIVQILSLYPTSHKLWVLFNTHSADKLPYFTLKEYLDKGLYAHKEILKFRYAEEKTANELRKTIEKYITDNELIENAGLSNRRATQLSSDIHNKSIYDLINSIPCSIRLKNCINNNFNTKGFPCKTVGDYLRYGNKAKDLFLEFRNFGRKTAQELDDIILSFANSTYSMGVNKEEATKKDDSALKSNIPLQDLNVPIVQILSLYPTSHKLWVLFNTHSADKLPYFTLKEYLDKGLHAHEEILKFRYVGENAANELRKTIEKYITDNELIETSRLINTAEKQLDSAVYNKSIYDLINSIPCSARLKNCINDKINTKGLPCKTVGDYLRNGNKAKDLFLEFRKFGRKTAQELDDIIHKFISNAEGNKEEAKTIPELTKHLLEKLSPKEAKVISLRYGINGKGQKTLEEIGNDLEVTRERARQIEKKAINKLSLNIYRNQIRNLIDKHKKEIYRGLADNHGVIKRKNLPFVIKKIPSEQLLLIDINYGSLQNWLQSIAKNICDNWYLGEYSQECIERCLEKIKKAIKNTSLPALVRTIKTQVQENDELINICLNIDDQFHVFKNIVFDKPFGIRKRRQANLYEILYNNPQPLSQLIETHNAIYQNEKCSYRDALIVMFDAPHLFITLGDEGWATIGHFEQSYLLKPSVPNFTPEIYDDDGSDDDHENHLSENNLVGFVRQILRKTGPIHLTELIDLFKKQSGNKYSPNSLGPILQQNEGFIRLAPGIYGLQDDSGEIPPIFLNTDILMRKRDCYLYVISRWAGEPVDSFPLWSYELEYKWCKWARHQISEDLFFSLLTICNPFSWPTSNDEKTFWFDLKNKKGSYRFDKNPKHPLYKKTPSLRELYAVLMAIENKTSTNWIRINRILGRRLNDTHSTNLLAILIGLDIVFSADNWQRPHFLKTPKTYLTKELGELLTLNGTLSWSSSFGKKLIDKLQTAADSMNMGWVNHVEYKYLISELSDNKILDHDNTPNETLESLLKKHGRKKKDSDLTSLIKSLL